MKIHKTYLSLTLLIILTTFSWITSCTHSAKISDIPEVCFERDVLPIFINNCMRAGCHGSGGESRMALDTYAGISRNVVPGNPNGSRIYTVLTNTWGINLMPPNQPLTLENRTLIRVWIEQGARQTTCTIPVTNIRNSEN
ncbi:MAG TPA: hypothetical protein VIK07_09790 [Bacteroidales bacterium]